MRKPIQVVWRSLLPIAVSRRCTDRRRGDSNPRPSTSTRGGSSRPARCAAAALLLGCGSVAAVPTDPISDRPTILEIQQAAEAGNADAQAALGSMFHAGNGVPQAVAQALSWYRRAAEQGERLGAVQVGRFIESDGDGPRFWRRILRASVW